MSVKERVKIYIKHCGLTVSAFEKSIGVSNGYINNMNKSIGIDKLELILELYSNLSIEWLITGKGSMLILEPSSDKAVTTNSEPANPTELKLIAALEKNIDHLEKQLNECLAQKKGSKTSQTVDANNLE